MAALFVGGSLRGAAADELALQARLIWGTDPGSTKTDGLKDLDATTKAKLKKVFKWEEYYLVQKKSFRVAPTVSHRLRMSPKCELEVQNLGRSHIEVKLFGEGKLVVRKKQVIKPGELLVLAGDDKNDTAWFVILTLQSP